MSLSIKVQLANKRLINRLFASYIAKESSINNTMGQKAVYLRILRRHRQEVSQTFITTR